jgi:hypothetical protein
MAVLKKNPPTVDQLYQIEFEAKKMIMKHGKSSDEMLAVKNRWINKVLELREVNIMDIRCNFEDCLF